VITECKEAARDLLEFYHTLSRISRRKGDRMALEKFDGLELPAAADMHVHLREGPMTDLIV